MAHQTWPESRTLLIWSVPVCVCLSTVGYWLSRALDPDNEEALFQYQTRQALSVKTCCRMIGQGWHCGMWERWNQSREFRLLIHFGRFAAFPQSISVVCHDCLWVMKTILSGDKQWKLTTHSPKFVCVYVCKFHPRSPHKVLCQKPPPSRRLEHITLFQRIT